ncbi:ROK family protein [Tellurirhabdus bombi]|uniref:ROK family protein n=1 Tax=Tellurirhabdus bombi TaxID=2907205 RepID=UPI001F4895E4|nr:ROK family protein [Tellurirhabdus bombi]
MSVVEKSISEPELTSRESVVDIKKNRLKNRIIRELYKSGTSTIAHLARLLHASVPSITTLIEELIGEKWLLEIGTGEAQFGRKPVLFGLNPYRHLILILDINTHDTKLIIFNLNNQIIARHEVSLQLIDSTAYLKDLYKYTETFLQEAAVDASDILAIGVAMPGLINPALGVNYTYKKLNSPNISFGKLLEDHFQTPIYIINDTKATVLGEHRFGLAKGKNYVFSINIDWGVGLGILLNGEVFQGASGFAGELGHIQLKPDGELCHCGKVGCLDTLASASSLVKRVRKELEAGQVTKLIEYKDNLDEVDVEKVIQAAKQGDSYSIDLLYDIGMELGKGLAIAVQLFNPEIIIIDGVLAKAERFITNPLEQAIHKFCLTDFKNNLTIEISQMAEMAKLYGTQAYVMEQVLESK